MTEHTTQSKDTPDVVAEVKLKQADARSASQDVEQQSQRPIIWTPRFIVFFFLAVVGGLSIESLFIQGWLEGYFNPQKILIGHIIVLLLSLVVLIVKSHAMWIRVGSIFGCIWAIFTGASNVALLLGVNSHSIIELDFQATMACALLSAYICFSTHNIAFRRWDSLFFWLAPLVSGGAIAVIYALSYANPHHTRELINATTTTLLWLSVAVWWLRPSCWLSQPYITFLFGWAAILMIAVPSIGRDSFGTPLFVSQVLLLCVLLGVFRMTQGEIREA